MATTKEINRITNKSVNIDKILCGGGIVYPYYKYRWKKYSIGYEEKQRDVVVRTPNSRNLAYGEVDPGTYYLDYYLSNGKLNKASSAFKYNNEGDFTFYTTGDEYYTQISFDSNGRIEERTKYYLPAGFYECRKSSFRHDRYNYKQHDYISVTYPKIDLVAELTVGKESYKVEAKGKYITTIGSNNANEYPENGVKDGYWYELIK